MHKTDEVIKKKIVDRLFYAPDIDFSNITVKVCGGAIELNGAVPDEGQRAAAEEAVRRIYLVRDVRNHIAVAVPQSARHLTHVA